MHLERPRRKSQRHRRANAPIDALEPRLLCAVDPELRWMIQFAGGTTTPSPNLTVSTALPVTGGYAKATSLATIAFTGAADPAVTASVKINGVATNYNAAAGTFSLANAGNALGITPGINRVQVRSYDAGAHELTRKTLDVWYDDGTVQAVTGVLSGNNTWTAAGGPYLLTGTVTVTNGASLTIQPGASVYLGSGARFIVNGKLTAQGTDFQHIRMTRDPVAAADWIDLEFRVSNNDNKLAFVDLEYARNIGDDQAVRVDQTRLYLDHVNFDHIGRQYLDITNSSIDVRNSVFPNATGVEAIHATNILGAAGQFAIFQRNVHGTTTGYNDVIDFTGGQRPGAILQVLDSWFLGGEDDGLDLDSTDAWIEGNTFINFHQPNGRNTPSSKSHAISTGNENSGTTELTITRNFFYNVDHAVVVKDGASATFVNNTVDNVHTIPNPGSNDATTSVFNLYEPRSGQYQANRLHIEGNILRDVSRLFEIGGAFPAGHPELINMTIARNILPNNPTYPGSNQATITFAPGNVSTDPLFVNAANVLDPTADLLVQPNSPAKGQGPNGVDIGAGIPTGVSLSGTPASGFTNNPNVTLTPAFAFGAGTNAAGYLTYKYRINNGAYSAEVPIATPIALTGLADGVYTIYALGRNDAGALQPEANVTASKTFTVDTKPPKVSSGTFNFKLSAETLNVQFDEDLAQPLAKAAITLTNRGTGGVSSTIDPSTYALGYDPATRTATITFPGFPNGRLPDGNYRLTVAAAQVQDKATNALDGDANGAAGGDYTLNFFQFIGDIDHNGTIDFNDLVPLAQNYNTTGKTYDQGDLNFDGTVDFNDLVILAQKYNTTLPPPASAAPASPIKRAFASLETVAPVVRQPPAKVAKPRFAVKRIG